MTDETTFSAWEKLPYLTFYAREVIRAYLDLDPPRSLLKAYNVARKRRGKPEAKQVPQSMRSRVNGKRTNGTQYPGAVPLSEIEREYEDMLSSLERQKWISRRLEVREREWVVGSKLLQRGEEMLMFPVVAQEFEDGKTVIMPAGWHLKDIPAVLDKASKLLRLSTGMSTENINVDWREEAQREGIDPNELFSKTVASFREHLESVARKDDSGGVESSETDGDNPESE